MHLPSSPDPPRPCSGGSFLCGRPLRPGRACILPSSYAPFFLLLSLVFLTGERGAVEFAGFLPGLFWTVFPPHVPRQLDSDIFISDCLTRVCSAGPNLSFQDQRRALPLETDLCVSNCGNTIEAFKCYRRVNQINTSHELFMWSKPCQANIIRKRAWLISIFSEDRCARIIDLEFYFLFCLRRF